MRFSHGQTLYPPNRPYYKRHVGLSHPILLVDIIYQDEWEPIMAAESIEKKIVAFAELAKERTENEESIENTVISRLLWSAAL